MLGNLFKRLFPPRARTTVAFQPSGGDRAWLIERLDRLAKAAWSRTGPPDPARLQLDPARLPSGTSSSTAEEIIAAYYAHARKWAPGLEIPFSIPPVIYSPQIISAGQFQVDAHGYIKVVIPPETASTDTLLRAVLAHESCHHILGCSGLNTHDPAIDEPLTDIAMFVCGLGKVFMSGNVQMFQGTGGWARMHLGYLRPAEYAYLVHWTQNLRRSAATGRTFDPNDTLRRKLLTKLGGNEAVTVRYLEFERRSAPGASEGDLLARALERIENERR